MADKTTNLQLQKIDDTDYAGNFPTIYNNNLDLIDVLNNKQDKLIAGSGIQIASDGKTISASGGKEYTAGDGIQISSDGVISIVMRDGTYNEPFVVSATILNGKTLRSRVNGLYKNFYKNIVTNKYRFNVTTKLTNSYTSNETICFLYSAIDETTTTYNIKIDLSQIIGKINRQECILTVLFSDRDKTYYNYADVINIGYIGSKYYTYHYQDIRGVLNNGILEANLTLDGDTQTEDTRDLFGLPSFNIRDGVNYSTFMLIVRSITVSAT